jgi:hypothetical protein
MLRSQDSLFLFRSPLLASMAAIARKYGVTMKDDPDDDDEEEGGGLSEAELESQVARLLEKQGGNSTALAMHLLTDNRKLRVKNRKANERATAAEGKVPKDGQVVVSKEDADALTTYKTFGKPDEVKTKIEKGVTLEQSNVERERAESIASAAKLAQIPQGTLLGKLADPKRENFVIELRDEVKEGKTVKVPFAKKNEDKAAWMPLTEFVNKELAEYKPALFAKSEGNGAAGTSDTTTHTALPDQIPSGTAPASGVVDKFLKARNDAASARPNPLAPPASVKATT